MPKQDKDVTVQLTGEQLILSIGNLTARTITVNEITDAIESSNIDTIKKTALKTITALIVKDGYIQLKEYILKLYDHIGDDNELIIAFKFVVDILLVKK
jgi:hypothetical protein